MMVLKPIVLNRTENQACQKLNKKEVRTNELGYYRPLALLDSCLVRAGDCGDADSVNNLQLQNH